MDVGSLANIIDKDLIFAFFLGSTNEEVQRSDETCEEVRQFHCRYIKPEKT